LFPSFPNRTNKSIFTFTQTKIPVRLIFKKQRDLAKIIIEMELIISLLADTNKDFLLPPNVPNLLPPQFLFQDDGSEINELRSQQRRRKIRRNNYIEQVVPGYNEEEFRRNFRLKRSKFEVIINIFNLE
jgi:hypothetical protein